MNENKIKSVIGIDYISITFHIVTNCNFSCYYCNDANREGNHISTIDEINEFINFIKKIDDYYNNYEIFISISGGEPLINKNSFYLIEKLLTLKCKNKLRVNLITNAFFLTQYKKNIKELNIYKNFIISISYHYKEYLKFDKDRKKFFDIINLLKETDFENYTIKFLMPFEENEFNDMKVLVDNLIKNGVNKNKILLDTIRFLGGTKLDKYNDKILDYYSSFKLENKINNDDEWINDVTFFNGEKKHYTGQELLDKELNNFYKYRCYPYKSTFLQIFSNLDTYIIRCKSSEKKYDLNGVYKELTSGKEKKYIICLENNCTILPAIGLKKEYIENNYKYDVILNNLGKYFTIEGLKLIGFKHFNNGDDINKINIEFYDENENILIFSVELGDEKSSGIYNNGKIFVHYYFREKFGEILKNEKIGFDKITKITFIIKKFEEIFYKILINGYDK